MTQFDETKLSRIMARRIIAPEDRSQLLPLCTPVFCPDNNGVKASKVQIIDPNLNTFYSNNKDIIIGANFTYDVNTDVTKNGTPVIDDEGIYTGSSTNYLSVTLKPGEELVLITNATVTTTQTLFTFAGNNVNAFKAGTLIKVRILIDELGNGQIMQYFTDNPNGSITNDVANPTNLNTNLIGTIKIDLAKSTLNNVKLFGPQETIQPGTVKNIIDIDLIDKVEESYFIPYEVDLKTDVDIINVIKSDFAQKFRLAVSNKIFTELVTLKTAGEIDTINMGSNLAEAFGDVLCQFVAQGTGQKYSVYKYNNGAPVEYSISSEQPHIDKEIIDPQEYSFSTIDSPMPALHYYEKPTLILPGTTYKDFQTNMCSGGLRDYVVRKVNVDTASVNFSTLGEGIFGTNDSFAVAFTQPAIKKIQDQDFFGYRLCCTMFYGIKLIHKDNLRLFT